MHDPKKEGQKELLSQLPEHTYKFAFVKNKTTNSFTNVRIQISK